MKDIFTISTSTSARGYGFDQRGQRLSDRGSNDNLPAIAADLASWPM